MNWMDLNWSVYAYYKIPEFRVHWKLFNLSNVGASWVNIETMSELLKIFCFGISYCLEFSITSNSHTRIYCAWLATKIFPKYGNVEVML